MGNPPVAKLLHVAGLFAAPGFLADLLPQAVPPDEAPKPTDAFSGPGKIPNAPDEGSGPKVLPIFTPGVFAAQEGGTGPFKDAKELLAAITDANLFGEVLPAFEKERSGKYSKVNLALYAVREVLEGGPVKAEFAKSKIEAWLNDYNLLTDKAVAHVARVNLIKALERTPEGDDKLKQNAKVILDALKATYNPPKPEDKPKEDEKKPPKKEEKKPPKPEDKKPDEAEKPKDPPPPKPAPAPTLTIDLAVFTYMDSNKAGARKDNFNALIAKVNPILKAAFQELLKQYPKAEIKGDMNFIIDNKTGNIVKVSFKGMSIANVDKEEPVMAIFQSIAQQLHAQVSFEKQGSDPAQEVSWPIDLKPAPPKP